MPVRRTREPAEESLSLFEALTQMRDSLGPNATLDQAVSSLAGPESYADDALAVLDAHTAQHGRAASPGFAERRRKRQAERRDARYQKLRLQAARTRVAVPPAKTLRPARPLYHPGHRMSGHDASGLLQDAYEPPVSPAGPVWGQEQHSKTVIRIDPWYSYLTDVLSPNFFCVGVQGGGKSFALKLYTTRQERAGRYVCVIDPKDAGGEGEWASMAHRIGWTVIRFGADSTTRINMLDPRIARRSDDDDDLTQLALIYSVLETLTNQALTQEERYAISVALERVHAHYDARVAAGEQPPVPIPSDLAHAILFPTEQAAAEVNMAQEELKLAGRNVGIALTNFLKQRIGQTLNAATTFDANLASRGIVWDVSQLPRDSTPLPIVMTVVNTFIHNAWWKPDGHKRILVIDEATILLRHLGTARALEASEKTSRGKGISHMVAVQHTENITGARTDPDLEAAVAAVINEAEIVVAFRQDKGQAEALARRRLLTGPALKRLPDLPPGNAVMCIGARKPFECRTTPTPVEWETFHSDTNMTQTPLPPASLTWVGTAL